MKGEPALLPIAALSFLSLLQEMDVLCVQTSTTVP